MIAEALTAGVTRDQLENFLIAGYIPQPFQLRFHAEARKADKWTGPNVIAMGGARGPGKSHAVFAQLALDDCQRQPGLKVLFLRKVKRSATESFADLTGRILRHVPHTRSREQITFTNGSRILIGGYKDEADIDKYLGIEYDIIAIEEVTQLTKEKRLMIEGSLRTSLPGWRTRMYFSTNPGGIGHGWFKEEFVIPYRTGTAKVSVFVPGTYKDNKYLDANYITYLESLPGSLGKAWRDGDWDAFEGMAFPLWNTDEHVVEPFEIPDHWPRIIGIDDGYAAPWCALWLAQDPRTQIFYVYREFYKTLVTSEDQAKMIRMASEGENILYRFADPSLWTRQNRQGHVYSVADEYRDNGVYLTKGDNDRIGGKRKLDNLLSPQPHGDVGIKIFSNCYNLIRTLPALPRDQNKVEDVDTKAEDHAYDALRYALTRYNSVQYIDANRTQTRQSPLTHAGGLT